MRNLTTVLLAAILAWGCGSHATGGPDASGDDAGGDGSADGPGEGADDTGPGDPAAEAAPDAPGDLPGDAAGDAPDDLPFWSWEAFDDPPRPGGGWFENQEGLRDFLAFRYHWRPGTPRPDASHLGDFGIGNGRVFAELGLTFPLNTLHNMVGPTYSRRDRFYGDLSMRPGDGDGTPAEFEEEWIAWTRSVPAVVTVGRIGDRHVQAVDFAPRPAPGEASRAVHGAIWRRVVVRNAGPATLPRASLVLEAVSDQASSSEMLVEPRRDGRRLVLARTPGARTRDRALVVPVPALEPGEVWETDVVFLTVAPDADLEGARATLLAEDPAALLAATRAALAAFEGSLVQVTTPDPIVNDYFRVLQRMIWTQISAQGASSPVSRYTMTWIRDQSGAVRALLALGAWDLARGVLDYYHAACALNGEIADALEADLPLDVADPPPVDWEGLPKFTHYKTLAESTSHLPLMHGWYRAATGDDAYVRARLPYLRHALQGQTWTEEGLQPFSDDETFRAAMNLAFGLDVEYPHHLLDDSLVSSSLMATAARFLVALEDTVPPADRDAEWQAKVQAEQALADLAEGAVREHFALPDGCRAAFRERATGTLSPPFEDANLMGPWAGPPWDSGKEAGEVVACLDRHVRRGPADYRSRLSEQHVGFLDLYEEPYTGMLPGYILRALTLAGHPEAEAGFHLLRRSLSPSGQYAEYVRGEDHAALEPIYDPSGGVGDYTARFRPWEGGINLEAALFYLTGFAPDAPAGRVALRPHLPEGWPGFSVAPLAVGGTRLALETTREADGVIRIVARHLQGPPITVATAWDAYDGKAPEVTEGGMPVAGPLPCETRFGTSTVRLPDCNLDAGGTCEWTLR